MSLGLRSRTDIFSAGLAALVFAGMLSAARAAAQIPHNDEFVKHDGARLTLGGETFRYSGPNIEWLGLEAYSPLDSMGPRYPSHFEVDDAMDTAKAMGARVIRSQTLGDSIGCPECIEPKLGAFLVLWRCQPTSELYNYASGNPALSVLVLAGELSHKPICLHQA